MTKLVSLSLVATTLIFCACADNLETGATYPTIILDKAHSGLEQPENVNPEEYSISATAGVVIDTGNYSITVAPEFKVDRPNMVHVVLDKDRMYKAAWNSTGLTILNKSSLSSLPGSKDFDGFRRGDRFVLAIGYDHTGITPGKDGVLSTMWMATGVVK